MNFKKRTNFLFGALLLTGSLLAQNVCVSTPKTSLVLSAPEGGILRHLYYGNRLSEADLQNISAAEANHAAYPEYGLNAPVETALAVKHADGNMTLQLEVLNVTTEKEGNAVTTVVALKDKVYPFFVNVCYRAWQDADVIESWTEISHQEKKPVVLNQFASGYLPIRRGDVWLSHLSGSWANEGVLTQEPLTPGMKVIKNKDGVRNSHTDHAEVMFSLDGRPQENTGNVIGAALCYSGNYKLRIETHDDEYHHFFAGINEENSTYSLKKDELFRTPELALTYSNEGLSGGSRNFHRWARLHKLAHGTTPRKILLNSWEGVYFDINQQGMDQMMADIASMGGELFVMDDGWFGDKYPRKNDSSSLGDWVVDKNKLPNGIEGLLSDAKKHGVKFGIWIEPEMANTTSELYEKHPDWVLKASERDVVLGRGGTQVVLDLANPAVQDFVFGVVDNLMTSYPEIDYIKWDANMSVQNHGSQYLTKDNQSHMYIEFHRGFEKICQRIIPLKYRIDVAMSGRLGMEIQPKNMTEEEKALCKNAIAEYKTIRPVVQLGDIYRLLSPYDKQGVASLMYVAPEKDKAVFYWWKTEHFCNQHLPRVKMAGLCADKQYRVHELNRIDNVPLNYEGKSFSGAYLMANGLEIPYNHKVDYHKQNDYSSCVLYLEEVK